MKSVHSEKQVTISTTAHGHPHKHGSMLPARANTPFRKISDVRDLAVSDDEKSDSSDEFSEHSVHQLPVGRGAQVHKPAPQAPVPVKKDDNQQSIWLPPLKKNVELRFLTKNSMATTSKPSNTGAGGSGQGGNTGNSGTHSRFNANKTTHSMATGATRISTNTHNLAMANQAYRKPQGMLQVSAYGGVTGNGIGAGTLKKGLTSGRKPKFGVGFGTFGTSQPMVEVKRGAAFYR